LGDLKKLRLVTLVVDGLQHQEPGKKIFWTFYGRATGRPDDFVGESPKM
jgi:hypothetical protein